MTQANQDWLKEITFPQAGADAPKQLEFTGVDGTPVFVGAESLLFRDAQFVPVSGNAGSVFIQTYDETTETWKDALPNGEITPSGQGVNWAPPASGGYWNGRSFKLRFTQAGDKVVLIYTN